MAQDYLESIKKLGLEVKVNEPLARHTTFKIGGPADFFVEVEKEDKLLKLLKEIKLPYFILGGGSNLLVADEGFRGMVIKMQNAKCKFQNDNSKFKIICGKPERGELVIVLYHRSILMSISYSILRLLLYRYSV